MPFVPSFSRLLNPLLLPACTLLGAVSLLPVTASPPTPTTSMLNVASPALSPWLTPMYATHVCVDGSLTTDSVYVGWPATAGATVPAVAAVEAEPVSLDAAGAAVPPGWAAPTAEVLPKFESRFW